AYLALGDLDLRQRRMDDGAREYAKAHALSISAHDLSGQAAALAGQAHAAQEAGHLTTAKRSIERALDIVEDQRAQIAEPMLATEYFSTQRAYYERAIDILMQLDERHPGHDYAEAALETSERARSRSLQELLARRTIRIEHGLDPALLGAEQAAEDRLRKFAYRLARLPATVAAGERAALQRQIDDASRAVDDARGRIRAASPRYAELVHPEPLRRDALEQLLDDHVVVLEYWLGKQRSYLWTVSRAGIGARVLPPRARIEALAGELRAKLSAARTDETTLSMDQLASRDRADLAAIRAIGSRLARMVLMPALADTSQRTVVVVADGLLRELPFTVLDDDMRRCAEPAAQRAFIYLPSIATLRGLRAPEPSPASRRLAIFADPVFRADDPRIPAAKSTIARNSDIAASGIEGGIGNLPNLPHTRTEAAGIASLAGTSNVREALGFDASRAGVMDADWASYRIIHFATHALLNARHPELSGIVLSLYDKDGHAEDGFVRMNDIYNLRMPVDLVVLSVCDSALGDKVGTDGMFTLSRAFFYAGARRVVASLWPVDDRASAQFMTHFYRALLHRHLSPPVALAEAQTELRRQPRWRQPYYWAGFVVQGDWK
ncbi:MAG: CHAT domain-containing protein, partial [Rhodanobacteraceae bacterium]